MINDRAFPSVIRVKEGDEAIKRRKLPGRILFVRCAPMNKLNADGVRIHAIVGCKRTYRFRSSAIIPGLVINPITHVVSGITKTRMVRDAVKSHALNNLSVPSDNEMGAYALSLKQPIADNLLGRAVSFRIVQNDIALRITGFFTMVKRFLQVLPYAHSCMNLSWISPHINKGPHDDGRLRHQTRYAQLSYGCLVNARHLTTAHEKQHDEYAVS